MQICQALKPQEVKARVHVCIPLLILLLLLPLPSPPSTVCSVELWSTHASREEEHVERVYYLLYLSPHPFPLLLLCFPLFLLKSTL